MLEKGKCRMETNHNMSICNWHRLELYEYWRRAKNIKIIFLLLKAEKRIILKAQKTTIWIFLACLRILSLLHFHSVSIRYTHMVTANPLPLKTQQKKIASRITIKMNCVFIWDEAKTMLCVNWRDLEPTIHSPRMGPVWAVEHFGCARQWYMWKHQLSIVKRAERERIRLFLLSFFFFIIIFCCFCCAFFFPLRNG